MAVSPGTTAVFTAFNTLAGEVNGWFADPDPSMIWGDGDQSYGWGGSAVGEVSQGEKMFAAYMNYLVDRCNLGTDIVTSVSGALPQVNIGDPLSSTVFNNVEAKSDALVGGRLSIEPSELSLYSGGSSLESNPWSAAINCTFRYTFASFAKARYFFNSGGAFNISGDITGYSMGSGWAGEGINEIFTAMGTVYMNHTQTTQSGSGGTPTSIGFYDLSTSYQTIFTQSGSGAYAYAYTGTDIVIEARYLSSGAIVEIRCTLDPGIGRTVDGTTTLTTQYRKLNDQSSGAVPLVITAPVWTLTDPL